MEKEMQVKFHDVGISTVVTHDPAKVKEWIEATEQYHYRRLDKFVIGLDLEWRPKPYQSYPIESPVALIQLCVGTRCLIFQILKAETVPDCLKEFLAKPAYTFVGVGIDEDARKLLKDYDLKIKNIVDVGELAAKVSHNIGLRSCGLKKLAQEVLGKAMEKPIDVAISAWDWDQLMDWQIEYACHDAYVSFELGRVLNAHCFKYTPSCFRPSSSRSGPYSDSSGPFATWYDIKD